MPTHQSGDLLIVFCTREGSTTAPSLPAGWTNLSSGGANSIACRLGYKVAASGAETSGTWTNATNTTVTVVRSQDATTPTGTVAQGGNVSTNAIYPALTMTRTDGTSLVMGFAAVRATNTTLETPPTGMTNRYNATLGTHEFAIHDTNAAVSSWAQQTVAITNTSNGSRVLTLEILGTASAQTVAVPAGSLVLTGKVPTVKAPRVVIPPAGSLALTTKVPTVLTPRTVTVPVGALLLTGKVPSVLTPRTVSVPAGSVVLTGNVPAVLAPRTVAVPKGALSLTGYAPSVLGGGSVSVHVPAGSLSLTGYAPQARAPRTVAMPAGGLSLTGHAPIVVATASADEVCSLQSMQWGGEYLRWGGVCLDWRVVVRTGVPPPRRKRLRWAIQWRGKVLEYDDYEEFLQAIARLEAREAPKIVRRVRKLDTVEVSGEPLLKVSTPPADPAMLARVQQDVKEVNARLQAMYADALLMKFEDDDEEAMAVLL
jgi:hypothetical protein